MCDALMEKAVVNCRFDVKGFSLRKHRMKIEKRYRDREQRSDWKQLTEDQKWKMKQIVDRYGKGSVWTQDPKATRRRQDKDSIQRSKDKEEKKLCRSKAVKDVKID